MKIFITGATGFIGKHLVNSLLNSNHEVLIISRNKTDLWAKNLTTSIGNLENVNEVKEQVKEFEPDAIIHLAWEGIPDYSYDISKKNLIIGLNILDICKYSNCKTLIYTGSCWEYNNPNGMINEESAISNTNPFKASKNSQRFMAEAFCNAEGIKLYWLRIFYVYGPGQRLDSLIPTIITNIKNNSLPRLQAAFNKNDFVYVEDVARFICYILRKKPNDTIFNVGSGEATKVIDVLKKIANYFNYEIDLSLYQQNNTQIIDFYADIKRLNQTGFSFKFDFDAGLKETIKYYI